MCHIGIFLTYDIRMPLQQQRRRPFAAGRGRFADQYIVDCVVIGFISARFAKRLQIIGNPLFIARSAGNRADLFKIMPYPLGRKAR